MVLAPNQGGVGAIAPSSLEMSNVDLANEFVELITTQRAFQANSKVITTSDSLVFGMNHFIAVLSFAHFAETAQPDPLGQVVFLGSGKMEKA